MLSCRNVLQPSRNTTKALRTPCLAILVSVALSSCAFIPQPELGLTQFVHGLSKDLDCLQYCASSRRGQLDSHGTGGTSFALLYPLNATLSVTNEGKINATASPNLFSVIGLTLGARGTKAGTLNLQLHVIQDCKTVTVYFKKDPSSGKKPSLLMRQNAFLYHDIINGKEYLYVTNRINKSNHQVSVTRRFNMNMVNRVICTTSFPKPPASCQCPNENKEALK